MKTAPSALTRFIDRRQALVYPAPAVTTLFLIVIIPIVYNLVSCLYQVDHRAGTTAVYRPRQLHRTPLG